MRSSKMLIIRILIWLAWVTNTMTSGQLVNLIDSSASISSNANAYSGYLRSYAIDGDLETVFWTGLTNWTDGVSKVQITLGGSY